MVWLEKAKKKKKKKKEKNKFQNLQPSQNLISLAFVDIFLHLAHTSSARKMNMYS
jgi:hypothetical protein